MHDLTHLFGGVLRRHREQRGLSQERLAEKADLNRSYLGEIERGAATPSLVTLAKLAGALDINLSSLIAHCEQGSIN